MPELPDLQVFSRNLQLQLTGKKLKRFKVVNGKKLKTPERAFRKAFEKQTLTKVFRDGKELRILFSHDHVLGLHLMLHGRLVVFDHKNENKHTIIELLFDDDTGLALTDYQGLALATLDPTEAEAPDALSKSITPALLEKLLKRKRSAIKNVLLDQHVIRGIGNAYADEILWYARISPFSVANKIPKDKISALAKSITSVLTKAEKQILRKNPHIISGEIRDFMLIHNAKKKSSPKGAPIEYKVAGSRKTYFTSEQVLYN